MTLLTNNSPAIAPSQIKSIPLFLLLAIGIGIGLWITLGMAYLFWLEIQVPLTQADLDNASWLGSPSTALHFTSHFIGQSFIATALMLGIGSFILKKDVKRLFVGLAMASILIVGGWEKSLVRIGLLDGTVRIGCYVPETKECRLMLGLSDTGYLSRYESDAKDAPWYVARREDAPWYAARREEATRGISGNAELSSFAISAIIRAPLFLGEVETLKTILKQQRAEVQKLKTSEINP